MGQNLATPGQYKIDQLYVHRLNIEGLRIKAAVKPAAEHQPRNFPLLMLGGMGASIETMLPVAHALPRRNVVLLDLPGIGGSSASHWPMAMADYTALLIALLDHLNYQQVDMLGYSWGGALAQQFANQCGPRCRRLVLVAATTGNFSQAVNSRIILRNLNPRRLLQPDYADRTAGELYGGTQKADPTLAIEYARHIRGGNRLGYFQQLAAITRWSSLHWLDQLTQPTLILAGSDDPLIPLSVAETIRRKVPNSTLKVFDDGHLFLLSQAAEVCLCVEAFLREDDV